MAITQLISYSAKSVGTTTATVFTAQAGVQTVISGLTVANTTNYVTSASVLLTRGGTDVYIVKDARVNPGGSMVLAGWDQKIALIAGDQLRAISSTAASLDVIASAVLSGDAAAGSQPVNIAVNTSPVLATPYVSGGLMTFNFSGTDGAVTTVQNSGTLAGTVTLYNSNISATHGPSSGNTSLRINGSSVNTAARMEVTGLSIAPTPFTLEGWFYFNTFAYVTTPSIFSIGNDGQNLMDVRWLSTNLVEIRTNIGNSSLAQGGNVAMTTQPTAGVWQHHAITADGTNYKYYLDGVLIGSTTNNAGTWGYVGTAGRVINTYTIANWVGAPFAGTWSDTWVWNCRMSNSVIYTSNFTPVKTGMF